MNNDSRTSIEPVRVTVYKWAGAWGPFKVNIPCGECTLTLDILRDVIETELAGVPVELEVKAWLSHWWEPLAKGGFHAPIVIVDGKVVSQGAALNRGVFTEAVVGAFARTAPVEGTRVFGKAGCPHCVRAKDALEAAGIEYDYQDVVAEPAALYEMLARVKPIVGPKTPVTMPQVWVDGEYVGGADAVEAALADDRTKRPALKLVAA